MFILTSPPHRGSKSAPSRSQRHNGLHDGSCHIQRSEVDGGHVPGHLNEDVQEGSL